MNAFEGENMQAKYSFLGYKIDLYFCDYKLAIEVYEKDHKHRDIHYEIERQKAIEKELDCKFVRVNPYKENLNIFKAIKKIHRNIKKSSKELKNRRINQKISNRKNFKKTIRSRV